MNMRAFCRYTLRRLEPTHGGFPRAKPRHTTHTQHTPRTHTMDTTHHTLYTNTSTNTTHNDTAQHTTTPKHKTHIPHTLSARTPHRTHQHTQHTPHFFSGCVLPARPSFKADGECCDVEVGAWACLSASSLYLSVSLFFVFVCFSHCVNVVLSFSFFHVFVYDLVVFCQWGCVCVCVCMFRYTSTSMCVRGECGADTWRNMGVSGCVTIHRWEMVGEICRIIVFHRKSKHTLGPPEVQKQKNVPKLPKKRKCC